MNFVLRLSPRNAPAYALFALVPLAVYSQQANTQETHGIVVANMDRSVKPGDDFYHYANGGWIKRTEIPPDRGYVDPYGGDYDDSSNDLMPSGLIPPFAADIYPNLPKETGIVGIPKFGESNRSPDSPRKAAHGQRP